MTGKGSRSVITMTLVTALASSIGLPSLMQVKPILLITKRFFHLTARLIARLPTVMTVAALYQMLLKICIQAVTKLPVKAASTTIFSSMTMKRQPCVAKKKNVRN